MALKCKVPWPHLPSSKFISAPLRSPLTSDPGQEETLNNKRGRVQGLSVADPKIPALRLNVLQPHKVKGAGPRVQDSRG